MRWLTLLLVLLPVVALTATGRRRDPASVVVGCALVAGWGLLVSTSALPSFFAAAQVMADVVFVALPAFLGLAGWGQRSRRMRRLSWGVAMGLVAVGVWATWIEPRWLEVTDHRIASSKLDARVRLVVVSDLQTDRWGRFENRVFDAVGAQDPDLVLFTGDYLQVGDPVRRRELVTAFRAAYRLAGLDRFQVLVVGGDVERRGWTELFDGLGAQVFDRTGRVDVGGLTITALSNDDSRAPLHGRDVPVTASDRFHVAFGHAPDFALGRPPADLLIAGHVHGGQVRLPGIGPLVTFSAVPRAWAVGRTDLDEGRILIVSRGLGMERGRAPRLRFLCRPELVVVDLIPAPPTS